MKTKGRDRGSAAGRPAGLLVAVITGGAVVGVLFQLSGCASDEVIVGPVAIRDDVGSDGAGLVTDTGRLPPDAIRKDVGSTDHGSTDSHTRNTDAGSHAIDIVTPGSDAGPCPAPPTCVAPPGGCLEAKVVNCACVAVNKSGDCDDGIACTTADSCVDGLCQGVPAAECDDGNACTTDSCDAESGGCTHSPNNAPCNDGDLCTASSICKGGTCTAAGPTDCDDDNPCTDDSCASDAGCKHAANTKPCNDGSACTLKDTCNGGNCVPGVPAPCDDKNPCTTETCTPSGGCQAKPNTLPCSDNNVCTEAEKCAGGSCKGGTPLNCDDGKVCSLDVCDANAGCKHFGLGDGAACNDDNACTIGDACKGELCAPGKPLPCDDGNVCTTEVCLPAKGCSSTHNGQNCDDGNICSDGDACAGGKCKGKPVICDDKNVCTADFCDANKGCQTAAVGNACDDGDKCTETDTCKAGKCGGKAVVCDDEKPCTADTCNKAKGCQYTATPGAKNCGQIGVCLGAVCAPGSELAPALSCKHVRDGWPGAKTGTYWLDPDGEKGGGKKYAVFCEMNKWGGGWLKIDNLQAYKLMTMKNLATTSGICELTPKQWRSWDGFNGATGYGHFCIAEKIGNWPKYTEYRQEGIQLQGYTAGKGNTYDAYADCYGAKWQGNFCVGPANKLKAVNHYNIQLNNGQKSPLYNKHVLLGQAYDNFQIRSREEGPQLEGVIWKVGTFYLR